MWSQPVRVGGGGPNPSFEYAIQPNGLPTCVTILDLDLFSRRFVEYCHAPDRRYRTSPMMDLVEGNAAQRTRITRACRRIANGEDGPFLFEGHNNLHAVHVIFDSIEDERLRFRLVRQIISDVSMLRPDALPPAMRDLSLH